MRLIIYEKQTRVNFLTLGKFVIKLQSGDSHILISIFYSGRSGSFQAWVCGLCPRLSQFATPPHHVKLFPSQSTCVLSSKADVYWIFRIKSAHMLCVCTKNIFVWKVTLRPTFLVIPPKFS